MNTAPVAGDDAFSTGENVALMLTAPQLLANDTDAQTPTMLAVSAVQNPTHGMVSLSGAAITFTPQAGYIGMASFEYVVSDGFLTDIGAVTITISAVDDRPVAQAQSVSTNRNVPVSITLTATDVDTPLINLTFAVDAGPSHGQLTGAAPALTYTPTTGYAGPDSFTFTARDATSTSAAATVSITVLPVQICGDGIRDAPEQCDDGNPSELDGCTTQCKLGRICNATAFPGGDRFAVNPATGTCYVSFDGEQTTFAAARTACATTTGYLASITSAAEQTVVSQVQNPAENPWIGGLDDANTSDTIFTWVSTDAWGYTNFAPGQPDNDTALGGNGDCLHLADAQGRWNDTSCTATTFVTGRICEVPSERCGDGVTQTARGEQCDDGNTTPGDGCSATCQLEAAFISEYIEGSSNNKAIEIKNPSTAPLNLTGCSLRLYSNGATSPSNTLALTQTIAGGDVLVLCHASAAAAVLAQCDVQNSTLIAFNGNDVVELFCNGAAVDVIGQIGNNPSAGAWGTAPTSTLDTTLRRKCTVARGDAIGTDAFDPATEWNGFAVDTFSDLGSHVCP